MNHLREAAEDPRTKRISSKRLVLMYSAAALILVAVVVGVAVGHWIAHHGTLDKWAAAAFISVEGSLATLAGVAYRKADSALPRDGEP